MTRALPDERIELRLALVCYGGVSLAVYMHGVTKELHKLVQASRKFDAMDPDDANPFDAEDSAFAYFEALREIARNGRRLSVSIDVISGTSAGGINGVVLGKVLARGGSQEKLKRLWIDAGDLKTLLRAPAIGGVRVRAALAGVRLLGRQLIGSREDKSLSPLKGERMSRLLVDAIGEIDASADGSLIPQPGSLDLFVTATDLHGFEMLVPTGVGGASQHDRQHAQVLRFTADGTDTAQFGPKATGALAFAARATSAFPGAFAPVNAVSFGTESGEKPDIDLLKQRFVYPYEENGATAVDAWFVDGGVLDNAPFDLVVRAVADKRAESQVVRRIVYIQPDPGLPPTQGQQQGGGAQAPTWLGGLTQAVWEVKGNHDVLRDLIALRDLNLHIAEVGSITATQMAAVEGLLRAALAGTGLPAGQVTQEAFRPVSDAVHRKAAERLGADYPTYVRLKLEATVRRLADEVARRFTYPSGARRESFLRAAAGAWVRSLPEWADQDPDGMIALLKQTDLPYRERRLFFLLAGINSLYPRVGADAGAPKRTQLDALKRKVWDLLQKQRDVAQRVVHVPEADFLDPIALDENRIADPAAFAADHAKHFHGLFDVYGRALEHDLGDGSSVLWVEFEEQARGWDEDHRRALLDRYLAFPFWDGLIFPTVALAALPQFTPIGVAQFSPLTARALTPDGAKLKGLALFHFAGFVKPEWRQNDYLWGRLDGVELNLRTLYDAGSEHPAPARTTQPASVEEAVRTAGGPVLQQGLRAVLAAETDLTGVARLRGLLGDQVEELLTAR
ncbi:patatin-like protein [Petropleomorpha daqingensis]|uniref:Patatin-related protein n=1 Tax=Petropleomorpha daqingensis TaxID=2026353 RepID=A0A853CKQ4_9ACTN|nr:patatin-like protein [Petropleomorpha daqingensis]NYJ08654.1 patatin-related protein [Petropleomorpha daqingensis]